MRRCVQVVAWAMVVIVGICACDVAYAGKKKAPPVKVPPAPSSKTVVKFTGKFHGDADAGWTVVPSKDGLATGHTVWSMNIPKEAVGDYVIVEGKPEDLVGKDVTVKGCFGFKRAPASPPNVLKLTRISTAGVAAGAGARAASKAEALMKKARVVDFPAEKPKKKAKGKPGKKRKKK